MVSQLDSFSNFGKWNLPLRIQRRGNFFSDDGFQDYRRYFESAAKDLLQEFDICRNEDTFKTYRRLRDHQLTGTDRAAKIAEETDKYKIVMDVEGFSESDLHVTVSGPSEIEVEGKQKYTNGGGTFSEKSFRRKFSLPGLALVEEATSVLSSDHVLTVHIPKKIQEVPNHFDDLERHLEEKFRKSGGDSFLLSEPRPRQASLSPSRFGADASHFFDLKIVPRQSFFDDSFFENVRHNFKKSIDDLVEKRRRRMASLGEDGLFTKVRESQVENAQALSVTEDANEHKIVLDVSGFSEEDLKLKAVTENELVVEGKMNKKTACTSCSHAFKRKFVLPSSVDIKKATSALSSEGILTIIVPKKSELLDYPIPVRAEMPTSHVTSDAAAHISNVLKKEHETKENIFNTKHSDQFGQSFSSTTKASESQNLMNAINNTREKGVYETVGKREHVVPISLEGQESSQMTEKKINVTQEVHQPSSVLKESHKFESEYSRLNEDAKSAERQTPKEHFIPVGVDAGKTTQANSKQTTYREDFSRPSQSSIQQDHKTTFSNSRQKCRIVPITLKGSVYDESIFSDTLKSIEKNVQDVFSNYHDQSSADVERRPEVDHLHPVPHQNSSPLVKNGQGTSTIQEDDHSYKIIVDVYGFQEKELKVKVSGVNEISIEGVSEESKNGSTSKHSFQRTFQLPDCIDVDRAVTALSNEGILTITVPKKNQLLLQSGKASPFASKMNEEMKTTLVIDSSGIVQDSQSDRSEFRDNLSQISARTSATPSRDTGVSSPIVSQTSQSSDHKREFVVPVSVDDVSDVASEVGSVYSTSNLSSQISTISDTSRDIPHSILSTSTSASSIDTQIQSRSHAPSEDPSSKVIHIQDLDSTDATYTNTRSSSTTESSFQKRDGDFSSFRDALFNLPIVARGHFFDDTAFRDSRSMFESILRNKMNRFSKSSSFVDDLGFLKSLREKRITGGSQVASLSEDDQFKKIVLDAQGFTANDLRVKVISENEILVEGEVEERSGNSLSKKRFCKYFVFPGRVDLQGATSDLSSDGVLNIKIPKLL